MKSGRKMVRGKGEKLDGREMEEANKGRDTDD